MKILLTGACGVTSRAVARSLAMSDRFRDARLIGCDTCENVYGLYEGLCERIYRVPSSRSPEYLGAIEALCAREQIDVAIIIPELEVLFWTENKMPVPALLPPPKFSRLAISKRSLYDLLRDTGLVPQYAIVTREEITQGSLGGFTVFPVWLRDFSDGGTSGKGALQVHDVEEAKAWAILNRGIDRFMVSQLLPGRNLACLLLYYHGELLKVGVYERLEYFMGRVVPSGISGNISRGHLLNDTKTREVSERAVAFVTSHTGETMHGLVTVDLREDAAGIPMVTEINLRHVAATSAFASVPGANLAEAQLHAALAQPELAGPLEVPFSEGNLILRDIDGLPIWIPGREELAVGDSISVMDRPRFDRAIPGGVSYGRAGITAPSSL